MRDDHGEMRGYELDDRMSEGLLSGAVSPEDAPPGYERVAELTRLARRSPSPMAHDREAAVVQALAAAVRRDVEVNPARIRTTSGKRFTAKTVAVASAGLLLCASAAAAATNSLPDAAQTALSKAAAHVGVDLPRRGTSEVGHNSTHTPGNGNATGPDATGAAKFGLCRAFAVGGTASGNVNPHGKKTSSVASQNLAKAAASAGQTIEEFCKDVTPGSSAGDTSGDVDESGNVSGDIEAPHGAPRGSPTHGSSPVTTPNPGGTGTGGDASEGSGSAGSSTAGTASGRASSLGSWNSLGRLGLHGHP